MKQSLNPSKPFWISPLLTEKKGWELLNIDWLHLRSQSNQLQQSGYEILQYYPEHFKTVTFFNALCVKNQSIQIYVFGKLSIDPSKMDMMHDSSSSFCAWY